MATLRPSTAAKGKGKKRTHAESGAGGAGAGSGAAAAGAAAAAAGGALVTDGKSKAEKEAEREKKKKKAANRKVKDELKDTQAASTQNSWQKFNTGRSSKSKNGFMSGGKAKESIFKSPANNNSKVGVGTNGIGGKGMTEFTKRDKWTYNTDT
jgi:survival-of-motor-neuron-related-splicing factor 30